MPLFKKGDQFFQKKSSDSTVKDTPYGKLDKKERVAIALKQKTMRVRNRKD